MKKFYFDAVGKLSEVRKGLLCHSSGEIQETSGIEDGEQMSAMMQYLISAIRECGESLSLSKLKKLSITGKGLAGTIFVNDNTLCIFELDPTISQRKFEKKIESMKQSGALK